MDNMWEQDEEQKRQVILDIGGQAELLLKNAAFLSFIRDTSQALYQEFVDISKSKEAEEAHINRIMCKQACLTDLVGYLSNLQQQADILMSRGHNVTSP